MDRHVREEEFIAEAIKSTRRGVRDVQRPTGTEKARTVERVEEVAGESAFAKELAEQLETELGAAQVELAQALDDSAEALSEAGLAGSAAAQAVADAAAAVVQAGLSDVAIQGGPPRVNYAPAIKGDGTWAEVRRNLVTNSSFEVDGSGWSMVNGTGSSNARSADRSLFGSYSLKHTYGTATTIDSGASFPLTVEGGATYTLSAYIYSTDTAALGGLRVTAYGSTLSATQRGTVTEVSGEWVRLSLSITPVSSGLATLFIGRGSGTGLPGGVVYIDGVLVEKSSKLGGFFDGSTPARTVDPDMRQRWLGTPNASASVMEIERVAGVSTNACIAGVSTKAGKPAARIIVTSPTVRDSFMQFTIPSSARSGGTILGTVHLDAPLSTEYPADTRPRSVGVYSPNTRAWAPNEAGSFPLRNQYGALTGDYLARWYNGETLGSGDVWWTDIGLFAGDYDGPVFGMENILWIDTTAGANTPKRWSGSAWAAITDKVAVDAATAAGNAQISADGKNRVWYQGTAPAGTGHKPGDTWFDTSNGNRVTQWDGDSWEATQFGTGAIATAAITNALIADATIQSAKIANLDAAKITTGTLDAARIAALSISTGHLAANAVTAAKIAALTITAAEIASNAVTALKIAANAVTAEKINAGAVTTVKLDALAVTAEKIAVGAIVAEKIAAEAITTAKLAADAIDGMTITGALIRTAPSGQRLELNMGGLISYDADGIETSAISSGSGGMNLSGILRVRDAFDSVLRTVIQKGSVAVEDGSMVGGALSLRSFINPGQLYAEYRTAPLAEGGTYGSGRVWAQTYSGMSSLTVEGRPPSVSTPAPNARAVLESGDGSARLLLGNGSDTLVVLEASNNELYIRQEAVRFEFPVIFAPGQPGIVRSFEGTDAFTPSAAFSVNYVQGEQVGGSITLSIRVTRIAGAPLNTGTVIGVLKPDLWPSTTAILGGTTFLASASSVGMNLNIATDGTCTLLGGNVTAASTIVFGGTYQRSV